MPQTPTTAASWPDLDGALATTLRAGCEQLALSATDSQYQQLLAYLGLLQRWNKAYNLTAVRDAQQMVTRHLLDSLAITPFIGGQRLI